MIPKVSFIIVTYNRAQDLKDCLDSISKQKYRKYEVVVLDNGSQDNTLSIIKDSKIENLYFYKAAKNFGTNFARNVGIILAKGEFIWFLDSDSVLIQEDCLSGYIDYFTSEINLGAIGGEAVTDEAGTIVGVKLQRLRPNGYSRGEHLGMGSRRETDVITTCNFFTTKKILLEVGGFDTSYFYPYFDDVDISYRIFKTKRKLLVLSGPFVMHKYSSSSRYRGETLEEAIIRLYFVIKEFPLINILFLPLLDLQMIFRFENFGRIKRLLLLSKQGNKATVVKLTKFNTFSFKEFFSVVHRLGSFLFWMIIAYFAVLPRIFGFIYKRRNPEYVLNSSHVSMYMPINFK